MGALGLRLKQSFGHFVGVLACLAGLQWVVVSTQHSAQHSGMGAPSFTAIAPADVFALEDHLCEVCAALRAPMTTPVVWRGPGPRVSVTLSLIFSSVTRPNSFVHTLAHARAPPNFFA